MLFESLSDKILSSVKKLKGQSHITDSNIEDVIKEIRLSLLEADVNFKVVKNFIDRVKAKAIGTEVIKNVNPGQMFTKIVHEELVQTLGGEAVDINVREKPSVIMMVGLQGAGKTTSTAKLGLYIRQKLGKKVGFVPADVYRPAAIEQLQTLAKQNNFNCFASTTVMKPTEILKEALLWAEKEMIEVLILDTAGRLQIDDALMTELEELKKVINPTEVLLVADAMLGQQAVNVAETFHQRLTLSGLVLTKVDGDARGGAALSIREITGIPVKFMGVGEKVSALEVFHPDRLAGRILDMGDVLSLVERAQDVIDHKEAERSAKRMMSNEFTLEDFLAQIQQLKKLGGFESMLKFLPGMGEISKQMKTMTPPDNEIKKIEAIIRSMTIQERNDHRVLNGSRRQRIAKGSGTQVQDVNKLVKQFEEAKKMMSGMMKMGMGPRGKGRGGNPFGGSGMKFP
ncbi:MAG: signal recognition particle protein [Bdellovibrionales bacterium RIFCSPHIGHO2_01_FULL_40_29]|nr:MAG: signal recognition particle protein [Bdellovibrionales bacterium RIFCSPHIGHO2_01_FULL_40_29]OFZ32997.1 MAG: signal recognition particle protein [Bdellovibrionales bacterium RIFCSPHIGHO2_02_FULL_40_15]